MITERDILSNVMMADFQHDSGNEYRLIQYDCDGYPVYEVYVIQYEFEETGDAETGPNMERTFAGLKLVDHGIGLPGPCNGDGDGTGHEMLINMIHEDLLFKEFQETGVDTDDIGDILDDCVMKGQAGRMYQDNKLWIACYRYKEWSLELGNASYVGTIEDLERKLFNWAKSEGFIS